MDVYRPLHRAIVLPLWNLRQGYRHNRYLPQIERFAALGPGEMRHYQLTALQRVIQHAYTHCPHYREVFDAAGVEPAAIRTLSDFRHIPVLQKATLRDRVDMLLDRRIDVSDLIKSGTGGTTDSPIPIYYTKERDDIISAEMVFFRRWFGWHDGDKVACLWGAPQDLPDLRSLKQRLMNTLVHRILYLFASQLDARIMDNYIEQLNAFKPDIIQCYSNPGYVLAKHALEGNRITHRSKAVVVTAEPCYPSQRVTIESAFGCPVFSFYGAREAGYIAVECGARNLHVNSHGVYLEILRNGQEVDAGEIGDVILTDLRNLAMPLIRYRIGDVAALSPETCACGSAFPVLSLIAGRETDIFVMPDGTLIPGVSLCDRVVVDCAGIAQLQFVQDAREEVVVKIVKGKEYGEEDLVALDRILAEYFQGKTRIVKVFTNDIPREASGKTRFCISKVPLPECTKL